MAHVAQDLLQLEVALEIWGLVNADDREDCLRLMRAHLGRYILEENANAI